MMINEKDFEEYADFLGQQESQELRPPTEFASKVADLARLGDVQDGDSLPWSDVDTFKLRSSELTIWAGVNGHGKSLLTGQVMCWQMANKRVVIASLEMLPEQTLLRMASQIAGCSPSPSFAEKTVNSMEGRLWLYDQQDTVSPVRILAMVLYCAKELKADHVVIDSLLKCGIPERDPDKIVDFVNRLQWIAKSNSVHVHMICHMRKSDTEHYQSGKMDIRGPGQITDLADNVLIVRRNKKKEKVLEKLELSGRIEMEEQKVLEQHDCYVSVEKNRHGQKEGTFGLFFDPSSMQYRRKDTSQPMMSPWVIE